MNKKLLTGIAALCLVAAGAAGLRADMDDMAGAKGQVVTLKGEVLDMDCFMNEGAHGKKHKDCAVMCLNNGAPVGLLTADGTAYFLTANEGKGKMKFYNRVRGWGGDKAEITGVVQKRAGNLSLRVDGAKKL